MGCYFDTQSVDGEQLFIVLFAFKGVAFCDGGGSVSDIRYLIAAPFISALLVTINSENLDITGISGTIFLSGR